MKGIHELGYHRCIARLLKKTDYHRRLAFACAHKH